MNTSMSETFRNELLLLKVIHYLLQFINKRLLYYIIKSLCILLFITMLLRCRCHENK